MEVPLSLWVP